MPDITINLHHVRSEMTIFWNVIEVICGTCIAVAFVSLLVALVLYEILEFKNTYWK